MGGLSGKETAGMEGAADGEAFDRCNGQRDGKRQGDRREEKIQVERLGGVRWVGMTLEQEGVDQT